MRHLYHSIISVENLLAAWREFIRGKRRKRDVVSFSVHLADNIFGLHASLADRTYKHGPYEAFKINDPKPRQIHKAGVGDRLLHHAIYRILYPYFERVFIFHSFSCIHDKGVHRALATFKSYYWKVSKNNTRACWVLKCDIRKFFASIDHEILLRIICKHIQDRDLILLLGEIIKSFRASAALGKGLPLGNLTSQLLVNIYMNEFDHFMKRVIKAEYYIRYADDFVVLSHDKSWLDELLPKLADFLEEHLKLVLHPDKVLIKTFSSGIDFLGWVHFPYHHVLRASTRRRMFKRWGVKPSTETRASYLGLLKHGNTHKLKQKLLVEVFW